MADRSILVRLRAEVGDFVRGITSAEDAVNRVATAATVGSAAIGVAVLASINAWADFDQAMSSVESSTHETTANMERLEDAALAAGASTVFSATEAAGAIDELGKAGVSTTDILGGGLDGALDLASAGSLDVADAAEIAATALTQFKLEGSDVGHIADLLAAGAGKAQGSVGDLGQALNQSGLVASQFGLSVDDTVGTLAAFASAGLTGSDSGTSFKTMLLALANPAKETKARMDELGISAYDAQGRFVGITDLAGQLQTKLSGLTQAQRDQTLAMIFGTDAIRTANVLYTQGASGIQSWIDQTNDAGYAQETAALKLDNLKGDIEGLSGAWETAAITTGSNGDMLARGAVQAATAVVDAYGGLGQSQQAVILGGAAVVSAIGLVGGGAALAVPKIVAMRAAMATLATTAPRTAAALGVAGVAAGALVVAFAALTAADVTNGALADTTVASANETTAALLDMGNSLDKINAVIAATSQKNDRFTQWDNLADAAKQLTDPDLIDRINDFAGEVISLGSNEGSEGRTALIEQLHGIGDALGAQVSAGNADAAREQFQMLAAQWEKGGGTAEQLMELLPGYQDALTGVENGQAQAAQTGDQVTSALTGVTGTAADAKSAIDDLSNALDRILASSFDVEAASDNYSDALLRLKDAAKDNGRELDGNTEGALANREAMRGLVDDGFKVIEAMARQGSSAEELTTRTTGLKQAFIDQATALGYPKEAVERYAATFDLIPAQVQTVVNANTTEAERQLQALVASWQGKTVTVQAIMDTSGLNRADAAAAARYTGQALAYAGKKAAGGPVRGPGTGTSDTAGLFALSNGEHVLTAAEVVAAGGHDAVEDWRAGLLAGAGRRAEGGRVGSGTLAGQPRYTTSAGSLTGRAVSSDYLSGALGASPGPVGEERYAAALGASALAADAAAAAETRLEQTRQRSQEFLDRLAAANEREEDRLKASGEARVAVMEDELDALRERQDDASFAYRRRQADEMDALRKRTKDEGQLKAAQRRQEDAERAFSKAQAAEVEAAQARIAAAKDENRAATEALSRANDAALKRTKDSLAQREAEAEEDLTAAKESAKEATEELKDAEEELAQARQRALALAEQVSEALTKNATLAAAFGDRSAATLRETTATLAEASAAAADAARNARGEDEAGALTRRAGALEKLAGAAKDYAAAQEAMGVDASAIGAGLDQVSAKIRDLGAAYGLTEAQVAKLTGSLQTQRTSGQDVLESMQRELARTSELAASVQQLQGAGLNTTLLDQVISGGTGTGLQLARAILGGGSGLVGQLNDVQAALTATANGLGVAIASARYSPAAASSTSTTLDAASVALLEQAIATAASRVPMVTLDGEKISRNVAQRQADATYAGRSQ